MPADLRQPQPIVQDAVENAFDHTSAASQMDPAIINQITQQVTQQVIASLQSQNLQSNGTTPTPSVAPPQAQFPPPPPPSTQPTPRSPTQSSTASSIPQRFTPPTPDRNGVTREDGRGFESSSPEPQFSEDGSSFSRGSMDSERSRETPRPLKSDTMMPRSGASRQPGESVPRRSSASSSTARAPFRRGSRGSERSYDDPSRSRPRPMRVPSTGVDAEATTLEKIWQPLFDNGNPTMRLGQFLRGLAIHLIDDYEPKGSHVVTPPKMLRFFDETKVPGEHYPWEAIFSGKMSNASLSTMYRKLVCQHHFVQNNYQEVPSIPSLTPIGFEAFMTCLIQAHPDTEFERLSKAVMNMPISNADNLAERFPKELSRRLLPSDASIPAEQRLISSLAHEPQLYSSLRGASNIPPPPTSAPPQQNGFTERERKPYAHTSHSNAIDDDDLAPPSIPIERERKPYSAREGSGKVYDSDDGRSQPSKLRSEPRSMRNNPPMSSQGTPDMNGGQSVPMNIPGKSKTPHRMSTSGAPPNMSGSYSRAGRRTPPPRNPYARSEPLDVSGMPAQEYASNLHPREPRGPYPGDFDDDPLRRYPSRPPQRDRSTAQEDSRGYPIPPRGAPVPNNGYDYGAGGPPVGSFPSRRPGMSGGGDDRRRSMYGAPPTMGGGDGGTDGYGSFAGSNGGWPPQQQYGSSVAH